MPQLALGRFGAVLDFSQQLRFDPNPLVRDPLAVGLGLADQRCQAAAQLRGGCLIEAMVDLAGVDQILALAPAEIDAVPLSAVDRKARDGQRLTLRAGLLDPVIATAG
jgi:hypothetical protein